METCWFCKKESASADCAEAVKMFSDVRRGDTSSYVLVKTRSVQFKTCEVSIPRCRKCKDQEIRKIILIFVGFGCAVGSAYFIAFDGFKLQGVLAYAAIVGLTVVGLLAFSFLLNLIWPPRSSATPANFYDNYPPIIELRKSHWQMGDRPPRN
jgi:hypothetical protein